MDAAVRAKESDGSSIQRRFMRRWDPDSRLIPGAPVPIHTVRRSAGSLSGGLSECLDRGQDSKVARVAARAPIYFAESSLCDRQEPRLEVHCQSFGCGRRARAVAAESRAAPSVE